MDWKKIKHYGKLSDRKSNIELNYMSWDGSEKYDLRKWGDDGKTPYKGITIEDYEFTDFCKLLILAKDSKKSSVPEHTLEIGENEIDIFDVFGSFSTSKGWGKFVTFTAWGKTPKYDIRSWTTDFSQCGKGVTLSEKELTLLIQIVEEINKPIKTIVETPTDVVETVNDLSDDLFI